MWQGQGFQGISTNATEVSAAGGRPRVLVLRSCRPAQFARAVDLARARHPRAHIVALSHVGHRDALAAAGVDEVLELPGRRFSVLRLAPMALRRLRRQRFQTVVVPTMHARPVGQGNLYRLAVAVAPDAVTLVPGDRAPITVERRDFAALLLRQLCADLAAAIEAPAVLLACLAAACLAPRRRTRPRDRTRILHIISTLGVGGAQRQLAELVGRTPADRFEVDLLVLAGDDGEFSRQWLTRDDVRVMYLTGWPRLVSSVFEIRRHCVEGRYDLVHTWLFMANVVGVAGARLAGVPRVIASVRNLSLWKRTWYRQWWFRAADVLSSHAADAVTVNAHALAADHAEWARYPARRIEIVHNGLDPGLFRVDSAAARRRVREAAGLPEDSIVIGTVGRLAPEKDHLTFLRALAAVRAGRPDVHGVIVGDGALRADLEASANSMDLGSAVTFLGERRDARELMAGFDVFVLASAIEGFPNVLLEAAFLGVPSIASRVGGSPDVLPDLRDTFDAGDAAAAAARVLALIARPADAAAGAEAVRRRALELFTADRTARRWFDLYGRCETWGEPSRARVASSRAFAAHERPIEYVPLGETVK